MPSGTGAKAFGWILLLPFLLSVCYLFLTAVLIHSGGVDAEDFMDSYGFILTVFAITGAVLLNVGRRRSRRIELIRKVSGALEQGAVLADVARNAGEDESNLTKTLQHAIERQYLQNAKITNGILTFQ